MLNDILDMKKRNVFIIDSLMGKGKTTTMLQTVPLFMGQKIIYIVEYLSEVDRVKTELRNKGIKVKAPEQKGRKVKSKVIKELLSKGESIVTTHSLLDKLDSVALEMIHSQGYIIIMDEVHKIIEQYPITKKDWELLIKHNLIEVNTEEDSKEVGQVVWKDMDYTGKFEDFKNLALLGNIFVYSKDVYVWTFPVDIFKKAKKVFLLTYLFDGSLMKSYFDYFDVEYKKVYLDNGRFLPWKKEYQDKDIKEIADKIHIYQGNLNFGNLAFNLSSSYFQRADKDELKIIKNNIYNYFRNIRNSNSKDNMWTTVKSMKHYLKGRGYTKGFVSLNARATNQYKHKTTLAYVYNRYLNPIEKSFFTQRGIYVNEKLYAVSELMQWVFRSTVREGNDIYIYIPSYRMRKLFETFLVGSPIL